MHEHHQVESIVSQAIEKAQQHHAKKVTHLYLALGELLGFDEGSIRLYFEQMTPGTILEGAQLSIRMLKPKLKCKECGTGFEKQKGQFNCPTCCSMKLLVEAGKEFYIEKFDIE